MSSYWLRLRRFAASWYATLEVMLDTELRADLEAAKRDEDARAWDEVREELLGLGTVEAASAPMRCEAHRAAELEGALREIHEFHCGCDEPGAWAKCVCEPREVFQALLPPEQRRG